MGHAGGDLVGLENGPLLAEGLRIKDGEVGPGTLADDTAIREPEPFGHQTGELADAFLRREGSRLPHHATVEPGRPRIGAVEAGTGQRPVRCQGGGVRTDHAERVFVGQFEDFLGVAVEDDEWPVQLVDFGQQDVVGSVDGRRVHLRRDVGEVAAREFGECRVVEENDAAPVAKGGDQAAILLHAFPGFRIDEAPGDVLRPSFQGPGREKYLEIGGAEGSGVHVEGDVLIPGPGLVHQFDAPFHVLAPAPGRNVGDLQGDAGVPGAPDGLGHRLHRRLVPVPGVGGVDAVGRGRPAQLGHFLLCGTDLGGVFESGGIAESPFLHPLPEHVLHGSQLVGGCRSLLGADGRQPQLPVGHQGQNVDRRPGLLEPLQVTGHAAPSDGQVGPVTVNDLGCQGRITNWTTAVTAIADHLGGDALGDGADGTGIDQQGKVGMAMRIDEAGSHGQAVGVHFADALNCRKTPNFDDAALGEGDIGGKGRSTGSVYDGTATDDQVGFHGWASFTMAWRRRSVASRSMVKPFSTSPTTITP